MIVRQSPEVIDLGVSVALPITPRKGEVSCCLLRQEKEKCRVAFYAKKRRSVALPFTPRKGVVSRCLLRQEKESSFRVAFYAKKRSHRVMSWMFFPKGRTPKKLLKTTRSRNESVKSLSTRTFIVSCPDALSERKSVQVVFVTIRNRDERYFQPNLYPNIRGIAAARRSRKPRSRFLHESAHPEVSLLIFV